MAVTLAQAQNLSTSKLTSYVIDEFRKSALLDVMPFDNTVTATGGTSLAYVYNRVTTEAGAASRALNAEYTASEAATTQYIVNLKPFGGSFEIDRVIAQNEKLITDEVTFQISQKIKATRAAFADMFINGDSAVTATQFDGIDKAVTNSSTELSPTNAIDLSSSSGIDTNWKAFLDNLRKVRAAMSDTPTIMLMNRDMYAVYQSVMDRAGINLVSKLNYGDEVTQWGSTLVMAVGDKPGSSNPIISTSAVTPQTGGGTTGGTTSIYFAYLGLDGVHAVSPVGNDLVKTYLPDFKSAGAVKKGEVEMVAAVAVKASKAVGVLRNIRIAA